MHKDLNGRFFVQKLRVTSRELGVEAQFKKKKQESDVRRRRRRRKRKRKRKNQSSKHHSHFKKEKTGI
jgi:hypothetical protein